MSGFQKASKKKQKARVALIGPPGSGKTYTALTIAKHLGKRIGVIDTERGSASKYAGDVADFDVCEPATFAPESYIAALHDAAKAGFDVVIIDSLSHAWEGEAGILDQVDKRGGRFDAWKEMAPKTRALIEAILGYPGHVIATLRTKTEYVVEQVERKGRTVSEPRKIGLAPKFKEGLEYEFDVVCTMDDDNVLRVTKSRAPGLNGQIISKPGKPFADALRAWLDDGAEAPAKAAPTPAPVYELGSGDRSGEAVDGALTALEHAGDAAALAAAKRLAKAAYKAAAEDEKEAIALAVRVAEERISKEEAAQ